jgi:hypothetical protein
VESAKLRHLAQSQLSASLAVARKRMIGDGGWGWSRKDSDSDITPITAATLALWGLESTEIEPRPKKRSGKATFA